MDEQLIGKVDGVDNWQEVRFGLIELKRKKQIDYEKPKGKLIRSVWLK